VSFFLSAYGHNMGIDGAITGVWENDWTAGVSFSEAFATAGTSEMTLTFLNASNSKLLSSPP
jgi:hypothetical protein